MFRKTKGEWQLQAEKVIERVHRSLPADTKIGDRKAAVQQAYPFGKRSGWPYKAWLKAQREYLGRFVKSDNAIPEKHLSPLERMMKATEDHARSRCNAGLSYHLPPCVKKGWRDNV